MLDRMPTMGITLLTFRSVPDKFVPVSMKIHLKELDTGAWFKFSDETVVPLTGKIKLGVQEDEGLKKV